MNTKKKLLLMLWIIVGVGIILSFLFILDSPLFGMILGFSGGIFGTTIVLFLLYCKKNEEVRKHEEKIAINRKDERKIMLRDKSGRYAYIISLVLLLVITTFFFILNKMEIRISIDVIISVYSALVIFEYVLGMLIFKYLAHKY